MKPFYDAQSALAFMVAQAATIEQQVYRTQYAAIRYPGLFYIDTSANPWTPSVVYYSQDQVGQAEWFSAKADDMPRADVVRSQFITPIRMAAIGYGYDVEEVAIAQLLGNNLPADKATAARRAAEEKMDQTWLFGDTDVGFKGLVNNDQVTAGNVADGAGAADLTWPTKTPDEILLDVNTGITGIYTNSKQIEMADTILLPVDRLTYIATKRLSDHSEISVLEWLKKYNVYTQETGKPLNIRGLRGLETAGASSTRRMVIYTNSPDVVKAHLPMPFRFWPVFQEGPMKFLVPGTVRLGPVDIKRPSAIRYYDGI